MTKVELKQKLFEIAKEEALKSGYIFPELVEKGLKEMISSGVERLAIGDMNSEERIQIVEANIKKVVEYMIANIQRRYPREKGLQYRSLNESLDIRSFSEVRFSICPLWPFC